RGETRLCEVEPIVVRSTRSPVNIIKNDEGWLYDFGVNTAGIFRLNIDGDEGQQVDLLFGEVREGDRLVLDNIHCGPDDRFQEDRYICNGKGPATYSPHFTYHGYQYAQVNGLRDDQAVPELLTCIEMSCDIPTIGEFSCSDTVINRVQEATLRSDICNFYHFPTDCPQREKNGWTADASLSAEQVLLNLKPENCYRIWLHNIYKAMHDDGQLPGIVPTDRWGYHWGNGPAWDNVLVLLPYYTYRYRGDRRILEEAATPILRYLQYLYTRLDENELMCIGLGDWNHAGRRCDQYEAPLIVTDSILTVEIAEKAAFIYRVLGMSAQEQFAATLATTVRNAFRRHLIDFETGIVHGNCQTCQAMALHYGMFEAEEKPLAFNYLLKLVERADNHLDAGVLGGRVLFRVLADFGMTELAYHMIVRPDFPSYGNWIARGATTLWETFYPEGGTPSSLNHCFWGDISAWFYIYLGGIRLNPDGDDIHRLDIAPVFIESLTYAKASHRSVDGDIAVCWERTEDGVRLEVTAPNAAHGSILLPTEYCFENGARQVPLSCGVYHCHKESCV
ncbi:MAG: family 78 glycoside hydrolase catalytic domain, partial [Clostridia bacterium]|nr:family 78 glycoside hydrolase catalytic domain [Clostridia bacterium]